MYNVLKKNINMRLNLNVMKPREFESIYIELNRIIKKHPEYYAVSYDILICDICLLIVRCF